MRAPRPPVDLRIRGSSLAFRAPEDEPVIDLFPPALQALHELAARGRRDLAKARKGGAASKRLHDERRAAWLKESARLQRAGIENRWERSRHVAAKFRTTERPGYPARSTVYRYLCRFEGRPRRRPVT